uniref:Uncharacterized protein n=1 Tax=Candidatus Kentrum sp. TC TaxID=2126339 RepID=A0A450YBM3_9GAMM|nr:MAG: hypothetical protein BECKTC1821E_GA0114239_100342 [Candidatus Kentron sp. TC]
MSEHQAILETTTIRLEIRNSLPGWKRTQPSRNKRIPITQPSDPLSIMRAVLCRENESDRRKEHLRVVGSRLDKRILYIELVRLDGVAGPSWICPPPARGYFFVENHTR